MSTETALDVPAIVVELLTVAGLPVMGERPAHPTLPLVTVADSGGGMETSDRPIWIQRGDVQIDVWSNDRFDGRDLADRVREVILLAPRGPDVADSGIVVHTRCQQPHLLRDSDLPGPDGQPAYRHMVFASVTVRPRRASETPHS